MPIAASDIVLRLSGGASNASAAASLGGAMSSTVSPDALFDNVTSAEAAAGEAEYRCVYVRNGHATLALQNAVAYLASNTPSTGTSIALGVGSSAINGTEQTIANEGAAPAGVTFSEPGTKAAGVALGTIPAGQTRALWIRRTVNAGASAGLDSASIAIAGDTAQ